MLRLQAFKFELRPNGEQLRNLRQFAGSCRFVYNKALALNVERYDKKEKGLGYAGLYALLPNWKMEQEFLANVPAHALQQALKNLERAYTNFFQKRADVPKFKKKGQRESFRIPQGFEVDNQNGRIKYQVAQTWLGALPQVAKHSRRSEQRHHQRIVWQVVRLNSNGAGSRNTAASFDISSRYGLGRSQLRNAVSDGEVVEQCQPPN